MMNEIVLSHHILLRFGQQRLLPHLSDSVIIPYMMIEGNHLTSSDMSREWGRYRVDTDDDHTPDATAFWSESAFDEPTVVADRPLDEATKDLWFVWVDRDGDGAIEDRTSSVFLDSWDRIDSDGDGKTDSVVTGWPFDQTVAPMTAPTSSHSSN